MSTTMKKNYDAWLGATRFPSTWTRRRDCTIHGREQAKPSNHPSTSLSHESIYFDFDFVGKQEKQASKQEGGG